MLAENPYAPSNTPMVASDHWSQPALNFPHLPVSLGDLFFPIYLPVMPSGIPARGWASDTDSGVIDVYRAVDPPPALICAGMYVELATYTLADPLFHTVPAAFLLGRVLSSHGDVAADQAALVVSLQTTDEDRYALVLVDSQHVRRLALDGYFGLIKSVAAAPAAALNELLKQCAQELPTSHLPVVANEPEPLSLSGVRVGGVACGGMDSEPADVEDTDWAEVAGHGLVVDEDEAEAYGGVCDCAADDGGGIWSIGKLWV